MIERERYMEFKRIDNETVRCIINEEDMKEYNIEIDDFLKNRGKIQEFLHQIVERAVDEVGYNPKNGMLAMQVMPLPRNRIAITFSEKSTIGMEDILRQVNDVLGGTGDMNTEELLHQFDDMTNEEKAEAFDKFIKNTIQDAADELEEVNYSEKSNQEETKPTKEKKHVTVSDDSRMAIYHFTSFDHLEQFCQGISRRLPLKSALYKKGQENHYYLVLEKGRVSEENYKKILDSAVEFGTFDSNNAIRLAFLEEHFTCLISQKATKVIGKLGME